MSYENIGQRNGDHTEIANALLLKAARAALDEPKLKDDRLEHRRDQYRALLDALSPNSYSEAFVGNIATRWWKEELEWRKVLIADIAENPDEQLIYRFLFTLFDNQNSCPFVKKKKRLMRGEVEQADTAFFERKHDEVASQFIDCSIKSLSNSLGPQVPLRIVTAVRKLNGLSVDRELSSARYKLLNKDWQLLKGVAIGGAAGVLTSMILGPQLGTFIGNQVGLYGAAAESFGLAFLGGGSIASGGFGMTGGSIVIGLAAGSQKSLREALTATEIDKLNLTLTARNLPIHLAIGKAMRSVDSSTIPAWIKAQIRDRQFECTKQISSLKGDSKEKKERRKSIEATKKLCTRGLEMAERFDWTSGYDLWKKLVK